MTLRRPLAALLAFVLLLPACSSEGSRSARALPGSTGAPEVNDIPPTILGLHAREEDVSAAMKDAGDRAFVTGVRMWSLLEGERLRATLEVARFAPDAPATTERFRRQVAAQVGGSSFRVRKVGADRVFVSAGNEQVYYSWFRGMHLVLLSVAADTRNGKALLRRAVAEVQP